MKFTASTMHKGSTMADSGEVWICISIFNDVNLRIMPFNHVIYSLWKY